MHLIAVFAVVALMVTINAFYVAGEFSTVGSRRTKVKELAEGGNRFAKLFLPVLQDPQAVDRYIAATQVGITISSLVLGLYAQDELVALLSPRLVALGGLQGAAAQTLAVVIILFCLSVFQAVLGELLPKSVALRYPEKAALLLVMPMRWSLWLLRPFIALLNGSALLILRLLGMSSSTGNSALSPEELMSLFRESAQGGLIDVEERQMLQNVLHLDDLVARQIMVPRSRMKAVDVASRPAELLTELKRLPHTRFPVYDTSVDEIIGMIHLKDLFLLVQDKPGGDLREILRELPLLPDSVSVAELWQSLRTSRSYLAVLFDEYGGTAGLVTLEDVMEEIFGELLDEFDKEADLIREADGRVYLRGDLLIDYVNDRLPLALSDEAADTVGGLVLGGLKHAPEVGDEADVSGHRWRVEAVQGYAISEVSLPLPEAPKQDAEATVGESA